MASHSTDADAIPQRNSDDEETSRRSRARVSRACVRCRNRKDKCDNLQPNCSNCANAGQRCVYVAATKKRGLPEGYVRGLEKLWVVMLQKVGGLDNAVQRVVTENEEELLRIWNHQKHGEELHTAWKDSSVLGDLERLLSRMDHTPVDLKRKRDKDDGDAVTTSANSPGNVPVLTPDFRVTEISATESEIPTTRVETSDQWLGRLAPPNLTMEPAPLTVNSSLEGVLDPSSQINASSSKMVPLPSHASNLLDQYFTFTHCWFPILDRPYILRKFYEHTRSRRSVQLDGDDLSCLWAICAYSQQQTKHLGTRAKLASDTNVANMRGRARALIPTERGPFTIGHVQALIILVLLDVGLGDWTSAWMTTGFAVRALLESMKPDVQSQDRNVPTDQGTSFATQWNSTGWDPETTKAKHHRWRVVLQGCFVLDTLISIRLGRPSQFSSSYLELHSPQLLEEDGHEEWEPWNLGAGDMSSSHEPAFVISCFNRLTELHMIANDFVSGRAGHVDAGPASSKELTLRLRSLSERYCFDIADTGRRPPHQMLLQASHFTVEGLLSHLHLPTQQSAVRQCQETLECFQQSWNSLEKCGIPSILTALVPLVGKDSLWSTSSNVPFDSLSAPRSKMAIIWPGFLDSVDSHNPMSAAARASSLSANTTGSVSSSALPISPPGMIFQPTPIRRIPGSVTSNPGNHMDFAYQQIPNYNDMLLQQRQTESAANSYRPMSIDLPSQNQMGLSHELGVSKDTGMGLATSPSFNGDEIDALFHEMAQLDTTQWTMDRSQGLKDFGFADDSTFEAFCNDPDRLMLSDGYMGPAFNGGLASGGQAPAMNMEGGQLGRMSFDDLFR
ncbi:hypothetical protein H2200_007132 [Cladophialophora chaetospira]|uniref:Zn(2)-C6 fungal-type domain-containing protein n=1 Tax=Cladophialophora chaetospira TaxID=386627 RepID=A0AA39CH65_9EURO|nr:hypothetical protein H2200_007132 [Cladophialophora chaetospira]